MKKKVEAAKKTGHGRREPLTDYQQILRDIHYSQSDRIKVSTNTYFLDFKLITSTFSLSSEDFSFLLMYIVCIF